MGATDGVEIMVKAKIRSLLQRLGEVPAGHETLVDDADLHEAGLSSYGTVELMVAIETEFNIEFPDALLTRATFGSIASIAAAVSSLAVADDTAREDAA